MNKRFYLSVIAGLLASLLASCGQHQTLGGTLPSFANSGSVRTSVQQDTRGLDLNVRTQASCARLRYGDDVRCQAIFRTDTTPAHDATAAAIPGYAPSDIAAAYALPVRPAANQTVAVIDAYNDPTAEPDLAVYRTHFGLPACTIANGCFRQVGQTGGPLPKNDAAWSDEISLDVDMVSATCPTCHILLVEANSATMKDLGAAVDEAVALGANEVSNSYSASQVSEWNAHYNHPGVLITASSGDQGTSGIVGIQPCTYRYVVCVGGTYLARSSSARGWTEIAWANSGSGCPSYPYTPFPAPKPQWQTDSGCANRSETDVSAVGDPATGVAVYDSTPFQGYVGWLEFGGTSVGAPIIASIYALAGDARYRVGAASLWKHLGTSALNDVTQGNNGIGRCFPQWLYICNAGPGYDGPTGVGTPNGLSAF